MQHDTINYYGITKIKCVCLSLAKSELELFCSHYKVNYNYLYLAITTYKCIINTCLQQMILALLVQQQLIIRYARGLVFFILEIIYVVYLLTVSTFYSLKEEIIFRSLQYDCVDRSSRSLNNLFHSSFPRIFSREKLCTKEVFSSFKKSTFHFMIQTFYYLKLYYQYGTNECLIKNFKILWQPKYFK